MANITSAGYTGIAYYSDSGCQQAVGAALSLNSTTAADLNTDGCATTSTASCSANSATDSATVALGAYQRSLCAESDVGTVGAALFKGSTYVAVAAWRSCPSSATSSLSAAASAANTQTAQTTQTVTAKTQQVTLASLSSSDVERVTLLPLNTCVSGARTTTTTVYSLRQTDATLLATTYAAPDACTANINASATTPLTNQTSSICSASTISATVVNPQSAILTVHYSSSDCTTPLSLDFSLALTPCTSSDQCSYSQSVGYIQSTCPSEFSMATLKTYLTTASTTFPPSYTTFALILAFFDEACESPASTQVNFLNQCVPLKSVDIAPSGNAVLSKQFSLKNDTLVQSLFTDSQCLVFDSVVNIGVPDGSCVAGREVFVVQAANSASTHNSSNSSIDNNLNTTTRLIIGILAPVAIILLGFAVFLMCFRRKKIMKKSCSGSGGNGSAFGSIIGWSLAGNRTDLRVDDTNAQQSSQTWVSDMPELALNDHVLMEVRGGIIAENPYSKGLSEMRDDSL
ncbi:hypothetical protein HK100_002838 [Physocladia obscura]|uniref:Uncharacterized protein n=1 Tax=Physocladia obscura TaxID=109957 RepID=A0AAD5SV86_9FUNG|nr:hypothetical protein HK100_002838 [Physocladia obscura]